MTPFETGRTHKEMMAMIALPNAGSANHIDGLSNLFSIIDSEIVPVNETNDPDLIEVAASLGVDSVVLIVLEAADNIEETRESFLGYCAVNSLTVVAIVTTSVEYKKVDLKSS